jgi:hypothetical protein
MGLYRGSMPFATVVGFCYPGLTASPPFLGLSYDKIEYYFQVL